jgi:hypothetical protein
LLLKGEPNPEEARTLINETIKTGLAKEDPTVSFRAPGVSRCDNKIPATLPGTY